MCLCMSVCVVANHVEFLKQRDTVRPENVGQESQRFFLVLLHNDAHTCSRTVHAQLCSYIPALATTVQMSWEHVQCEQLLNLFVKHSVVSLCE